MPTSRTKIERRLPLCEFSQKKLVGKVLVAVAKHGDELIRSIDKNKDLSPYYLEPLLRIKVPLINVIFLSQWVVFSTR